MLELLLNNTLFHLPAKINYNAISWCTYTEPELAHVGLIEKQENEQHDNIKILIKSFAGNDRAQREKHTEGFIQVITTKKDYVLGVLIIGHNAGELIMTWSYLIVSYPTISEISKSVSSEFFTPLLYSTRIKKLVRILRFFLTKFEKVL